MSHEVKIAFIGAGSMATEHARVFAGISNTKLCGAHSRTRARAETLAENSGIEAVCDSIEELWNRTEADLVVVAVNELSLEDVMQEAVRFPWTFLLEKPAGYNLAAAKKIISIVEGAGRTAYVGLNRRYFSATQTALEMLSDCGSGPRYITAADQQSFSGARQVGHSDVIVENMMYANSIHLIDYIMLFGRGSVKKVDVMEPWRGEESFMQAATIHFTSGDAARYEAHWKSPGPWACTVTCAEKRLEMRPLENLTVQNAGSRKRDDVEIDPIDQDYKAGFYRQAEAALCAVRGEPNSLPTLRDAYRTMELVHAIYGV